MRRKRWLWWRWTDLCHYDILYIQTDRYGHSSTFRLKYISNPRARTGKIMMIRTTYGILMCCIIWEHFISGIQINKVYTYYGLWHDMYSHIKKYDKLKTLSIPEIKRAFPFSLSNWISNSSWCSIPSSTFVALEDIARSNSTNINYLITTAGQRNYRIRTNKCLKCKYLPHLWLWSAP